MDYSRQETVFKPHEFKEPVHIVGCGATGSWVAVMLAKLGVGEIHLWDFDTVEEHNIPNQLYLMDAIGKGKSMALATELVGMNSQCDVHVHNEKVTGDTKLSGVVFMLTDTMRSRSEVFKRACENNLSVKLVIETRMGMNMGIIYAVNPCDREETKEYKQTLYTDDASETSECGVSQSLAATAAIVAGKAVWKLIKWHNHKPFNNEVMIDLENCNEYTRKFKAVIPPNNMVSSAT